jgi:hypothetical protein
VPFTSARIQMCEDSMASVSERELHTFGHLIEFSSQFYSAAISVCALFASQRLLGK